MKKIFASIVLPNLAAAAIIGSGFSVWFFGENRDKASTTASIIVENRLKIGEVYMDEGEVAVLHVDQTEGVRSELLKAEKKGYVNNDAGKNADGKSDFDRAANGVEAKGIYLAPRKGVENITGNINYHRPTDQYQVELVTEFKFEGGIKDFVGMKNNFTANQGTMDSANGADGVVVYTFTWAAHPDTKDYYYAGHLPVRSGEDSSGSAINFAFEYLKYDPTKHYLKDGGGSIDGIDEKRTTYTGKTDETSVMMATVEPHNDAEYSEMLKKIGTDSKVIITTTATIVGA